MWRPTSRRTRQMISGRPNPRLRRSVRPAGRAPRSPRRRQLARGVAAAQAGPDALGRNALVLAGRTGSRAVARGRTHPDHLGDTRRADRGMRPSPARGDRPRAARHRTRHRLRADPVGGHERGAVRSRPAVRLRARRTPPPRLVEHGRRARPRSPDLDRARSRGRRRCGARSRRICRETSCAPDGTTVWIDGGPFRHTEPIDGVAVVHVVAIEHGRSRGRAATRSDADLAPDQLAAVTHPGGAARIIAPAGSGKTRVLTERARHLLRQWHLPSGARQPGGVQQAGAGGDARAHARPARPPGPHAQLDRPRHRQRHRAVRAAGPDVAHDRRARGAADHRRPRVVPASKRNTDPVAPWIEALSLDPARAGRHPSWPSSSTTATSTVSPRCGRAYRARLERQGAVDFDDQIYRALLVLLTPTRRPPRPRSARAGSCSSTSSRTSRRPTCCSSGCCSAPGGAVFGVGDDDQTIYGYNGADPAWLIDFADAVPRRRRPSARGQLPLPGRHRRGRSTGCCGTTAVGWPRRSAPRRPIPAGGRSTRGVDPVAASRGAVAAGARRRCAAGRHRRARPGQRLAGADPGGAGVGRRTDRRRRRPRVRRPHRGAQRAGLAPARRRRAPRLVRLRPRRRSRGPAPAVAVVPSRGSTTGSPSRSRSSTCTAWRRGSTTNATPSGSSSSPPTSRRCRSWCAGGAASSDVIVRPDRRDRPGRLGRHARRPSPRDEPRRPGRRPHGGAAARGAARRRRDVRVVAAIAARRTTRSPTACCCRPSIG